MPGLITKAKFLVRNILCNDLTGWAISGIYRNVVPDIRWKNFRFHLPPKQVSRKNVAAVFWGFYESAEIRLIKKYFDGSSSVIEFGSSVGVVSAHLASAMKPGGRMICVEANPSLVASIQKNIAKYAPAGLKYEVLNYAIDYQLPEVQLWITDNNTETRVLKGENSGAGVKVKTLTLSKISQQYDLKDFTLVSDIEGAEIQFLAGDAAAMSYCKNLFIELHDTKYEGRVYSVKELVDLITGQLGFSLVEQQGPVCFFTRQSGKSLGNPNR
jgi:FkbM family methyltransferase